MGFTRADLEDPNLSPEDRRELEGLLARYLECDKWAKKAQQSIGVLLTSHPSNRLYLKASVESHKRLGYWITLAYDNYFDPNNLSAYSYDQVMPALDILSQIDTFVMPHHQTWGGVLYPYFWLLKFGMAAMSGFEYVWCANGDCIIEKPEGFPKLIELLGDGDLLGVGWEQGRVFNTTAFLARTSAFQQVMKHFEKYFIPFEAYEKDTQEFGNCEARLGRAILDLGLKNVVVEENPYDTQLRLKGYGTFYKLIGFRHIHAEHNNAYRNRLIPPEHKYLDERYASWEYEVIKKYWETKDEQVLKQWWEAGS